MSKVSGGFTLIELLIVILIISIVTGVALISINQNSHRKLATSAEEFIQTLDLAVEQAMLQPTIIGVSVKEQRIEFYRFEALTADKAASWQPIEDEYLRSYDLPNDVELVLGETDNGGEADDSSNQHSPHIVISTNGDITPFILYLGFKHKTPQYRIEAGADGNVSYQRV